MGLLFVFIFSLLNAETLVSFYRDPFASFASGSAPLAELQSHIENTQSRLWFQIKTPWGPQWTLASYLINPLQLSQSATNPESVRLKVAPHHVDKMEIPPHSKLKVLKLAEDWAQVEISILNTKTQGWVEISQITPTQEGPLLVIPYKTVSLSDKKGKVIAMVPPKIQLHHIKPESTTKKLHVYFNGQWGFLSKKSVWEFSDIQKNTVFPTLLPIPLYPEPESSPIKSWKTNERITVLNTYIEIWNQSPNREHGSIWWKLPQIVKTTVISFESLLKKPIYSLANNKNKSLISANGIYFSKDSKKWKKLSLFNDENHPVAIAKDGTLFVGPYLSQDEGESFQPFIRWEYVAQTLERKMGRPPTEMRLKKIHIKGPSELQITLEANKKNWTLHSKLPSPFWN